MAIDRERAERAIREFLLAAGIDGADARVARTPARVAAAAEELLGGEGIDPVPMLRAGRISIDGDASAVAPPDPASSPENAAPAAPTERIVHDTPGHAADAPSVEHRRAQFSARDAAHDTIGQPPASGNLVLLRNIRFRAMCEHHLLPFDGWVHLAYLPGDSIIGFGRLYDLVEVCSSRLTLQERLGEELVDAIMAGLDAQGALAVIEARQGCVADRGPRQSDSDSVTLAASGALTDPQTRADALRLIALGGTSRDESA
ncbi:GTP cyclohydrolase I [Gulosibacter molinativorax]|uniref:GTP cyclohydrolase 1 n=1 Tax=Gulosibacter molinativorax TaxID=256821 RepID=A0ABT7C716_9MICO|nr:GTP cyclohydrolase I [Gulosibacter molinativorax]MDJ1370974.1 hypothetical protein [Gulosibacter molinativorax]QUY62765.1 GTP cyclohydrolase 1 [Gulosibacter molinativorax]